MSWAGAHHRRTGRWPTCNLRAITDAPGEKWNNIDDALRQGRRGLKGGSSLAKLLKRFNWDLPDLAVGAEQLTKDTIDDESSAGENGLEALIDHISKEMSELATATRTADAQMVRGVERTRGKVNDELTKLLNKLRNSRQNRAGTGARQIRRLVSSLRPRGRPQERVLTALPFLAAHGAALADDLVAAADPFTSSHGVLEL